MLHLELEAIIEKLALKRSVIARLKGLRFDNASYKAWRAQTAELIGSAFGEVDGEIHPCTKAFLNYRIPDHYNAGITEMQQYYNNILRYQSDLLRGYIEDLRLVANRRG